MRGANYIESEFCHMTCCLFFNSLTLKCVKELLVDWGRSNGELRRLQCYCLLKKTRQQIHKRNENVFISTQKKKILLSKQFSVCVGIKFS